MVTIDGQGTAGILSVSAGTDVTVSGLTLADGIASQGGAIYNAGTLSLIASTIANDTATSIGGDIYNTGSLASSTRPSRTTPLAAAPRSRTTKP